MALQGVKALGQSSAAPALLLDHQRSRHTGVQGGLGQGGLRNKPQMPLEHLISASPFSKQESPLLFPSCCSMRSPLGPQGKGQAPHSPGPEKVPPITRESQKTPMGGSVTWPREPVKGKLPPRGSAAHTRQPPAFTRAASTGAQRPRREVGPEPPHPSASEAAPRWLLACKRLL